MTFAPPASGHIRGRTWSRRAGLASLDEAFSRAAAHAGVIERWSAVGGLPVRLRFAGDALLPVPTKWPRHSARSCTGGGHDHGLQFVHGGAAPLRAGDAIRARLPGGRPGGARPSVGPEATRGCSGGPPGAPRIPGQATRARTPGGAASLRLRLPPGGRCRRSAVTGRLRPLPPACLGAPIAQRRSRRGHAPSRPSPARRPAVIARPGPRPLARTSDRRP
jgi:hypothetical protein